MFGQRFLHTCVHSVDMLHQVHMWLQQCTVHTYAMTSRVATCTAWCTGLDYSRIRCADKIFVDIGCLCTSYCLMWCIFSDYFSCFLSRMLRWLVASVLLCFSLFGLFVVLKFLSSVFLLFSLWHWAQECSFVVYLNNTMYDRIRCDLIAD